MNSRVKTLVVAGALLGAAALVPAVSEGRDGNRGVRGQCGQTQQQCRQQNPNCPQDGQRRRDGRCGNPACPQPGPGGQPGQYPVQQPGTATPPATR